MQKIVIEIPFRLPSLNEYIRKSKIIKGKWNAGNQMKQDGQDDIIILLNKMPKYEKPIKIHFHWIEDNKRRDLDNVCFAKKFILDAMVKSGKLKNDNRKYVRGFTDTFEYGKESKVILEIEEMEENHA